MILTDTHSHLYKEEFDEDREEVMARAISSGVERIFLSAIDSSYTAAMNALADRYPENCFPMTGLHPCSVSENFREELEHVEKTLEERKYYAIGEIGLDYHWDTTYQNEQQEAFRHQIELAKQHDLPIVIHTRDAFEDTFSIVEEHNDDSLRGIFHCFTGTEEDAARVIRIGGFKMGIGGIVTFKNAGLDQVISRVAMEHLVLETDAPYLAPDPYRGKRNESAYLIHIAEKVAEAHETLPKEVAEITTENANEIFRIE